MCQFSRAVRDGRTGRDELIGSSVIARTEFLCRCEEVVIRGVVRDNAFAKPETFSKADYFFSALNTMSPVAVLVGVFFGAASCQRFSLGPSWVSLDRNQSSRRKKLTRMVPNYNRQMASFPFHFLAP
jgi:hypothetical protein